MFKKLIRKGLIKLALWMIYLLREAEKYSETPDKKFMKSVDDAEKIIKGFIEHDRK